MQAVMTRDLKAYYLGPVDYCGDAYHGWMKKSIIQKGTTIYGAVLVSMKPVIVGYKFVFSFDWEFLKHKLKPRFERHRTAFTWLWFYLSFERMTSWKPDIIIGDHVEELNKYATYEVRV